VRRFIAQYQLGDVDVSIGSETFGDVSFTKGMWNSIQSCKK
jgi:hypothetical protein